MTDIDPTPQNPPTIPDRLGWWRGEMRGHLLTLLGSVPTSLYDLAVQLVGISGAVETQAGLVRGEMVEEEGNNIAAVCRKLDALLVHTTDMRTRIEAIEATMGAGEYASTETANVRALLMSMLSCCSRAGISPDSDGRQLTYSSGVVTADGRRYALWSGGANFDVSGGGRYVLPVNGWDGWQVYVQTDAPSATIEIVTSSGTMSQEFPSNSWVDLGAADMFGWYVDSRYDISAYLRGESTGTVLHSFGAHQSNGNIDAQFVTIPGFETVAVSNPNTWSAPVMHIGQAPGYKLRQLSGGAVMISYWYWDSWQGNAWLGIGVEVAIGGYPYDRFYIHSEGNNTPFTVQLVTP